MATDYKIVVVPDTGGTRYNYYVHSSKHAWAQHMHHTVQLSTVCTVALLCNTYKIENVQIATQNKISIVKHLLA